MNARELGSALPLGACGIVCYCPNHHFFKAKKKIGRDVGAGHFELLIPPFDPFITFTEPKQSLACKLARNMPLVLFAVNLGPQVFSPYFGYSGCGVWK